MFPLLGPQQTGPQTGNGFSPPAALQQNAGLLGNNPIQAASNSPYSSVGNSTAPQSSTSDPNVASMVKALKGSTQ